MNGTDTSGDAIRRVSMLKERYVEEELATWQARRQSRSLRTGARIADLVREGIFHPHLAALAPPANVYGLRTSSVKKPASAAGAQASASETGGAGGDDGGAGVAVRAGSAAEEPVRGARGKRAEEEGA